MKIKMTNKKKDNQMIFVFISAMARKLFESA